MRHSEAGRTCQLPARLVSKPRQLHRTTLMKWKSAWNSFLTMHSGVDWLCLSSWKTFCQVPKVLIGRSVAAATNSCWFCNKQWELIRIIETFYCVVRWPQSVAELFSLLETIKLLSSDWNKSIETNAVTLCGLLWFIFIALWSCENIFLFLYSFFWAWLGVIENSIWCVCPCPYLSMQIFRLLESWLPRWIIPHPLTNKRTPMNE